MEAGEGGEFRVGLALIPIGHGGEFVGEGFVFAVEPPAQGLNGAPEILLEAHGIRDVPAIEAVFGVLALFLVPERVAEKRGRERLAEAPRAAKVVLRPRAAVGGVLAVASDEDYPWQRNNTQPLNFSPLRFTPSALSYKPDPC